MVGVLNHKLITGGHHWDFKRKSVGSGVGPEVVGIVVDAALVRLEGETSGVSASDALQLQRTPVEEKLLPLLGLLEKDIEMSSAKFILECIALLETFTNLGSL